MEKRKQEKERKRRDLIYFIFAILLFSLILLFPVGKSKKPEVLEKEKKGTQSLENKNLPQKPILKLDLLRKEKNSGGVTRNIFQPLKSQDTAPPPQVEEMVEEEIVIPFKLICIIENTASENIRSAILSKDGDIIIVKKGEVIEGELEVEEIEEECVVFKSLKTGKTKRVEFEGK